MTAAAKAKTQTIKLEPGTDLVGTVKFISHYPEKVVDGEKYSAQWALTGTFDGTEGRVYISMHQLTNDITPYMTVEGKWDDGSPKYKWIGKGAFRLHPYVKDKRHYVTVGPVDGELGHPSGKGDLPYPRHDLDEPEEPVNGEAKAIRKRWVDLYDAYDACVKMARKAWPDDTPPEVIHAAAATLLIAADKRNLPPPPKRDA